MVVSDSLNDDGVAIPHPPSTETPLPAAPARAEMQERWRMWGATVTTPNHTRGAPVAAARVASSTMDRAATAVPETMQTTPIATAQATTVVPETTQMTPVVGVEALGSLATGQTSPRRGRRF